MPILAATNIAHSYGNHRILNGCSFAIEPSERVGLVGRNGAGKTSLLKVLAGELRPDTGDVMLRQGARRGYLRQDPEFAGEMTMREAAEQAFDSLRRAHADLELLFEQMAGATGEALERLLRRQADLERTIETLGGYTIGHKVDAVLHGLGFTDNQFSLPLGALSGGQSARVALARLLLEQPDILLLDEPTNHLDIDGRLWLESFLADEYKGAVVMIAHDRYLLDRVVDRIVEVERGGLIEYPGNYTAFRALRQDRRETMGRAYEKEQTQFRREEAFIRKYKAGQRAKQARGRESLLDRARQTSSLEKPTELGVFGFRLPSAGRSGDIVASVQQLSKSYTNEDGSELRLFRDLTLKIGRGERWGVVGPNGAGKTTLVRTILGEIKPDAGEVRLGSQLRVGYFRQVHTEEDPQRPMIRQLQSLIKMENPELVMTEQETRDLAGAFLFSGPQQDREIGLMSGGERARVRLAALLASAKNVVVLDEPTNHLDIPSAERLEQALAQDTGFDGTVIVISHDRALIDAVCDHLLILDGKGGASAYFGNWSEYQQHLKTKAEEDQQRKAQSQQARPSTQAPRSAAAAASPVSPKPAPSQKKSPYSWMRLEQVEEKMHELGMRIESIDAQLADPEVWKDSARSASITSQREALQADLAELEEEWLRKSG